ncbi:MAG TPA: hypothetical protein VFT87_00250 [Candidatus Saccharimonadales bacterium]|nr:hypothetical protein [Candidatus Saccharimonadales bacterium]
MSKLTLPINPTIQDIQKYVRAMEQERGFTNHPVELQCLLLAEEVGELFKCIRKSHSALGIDANKTYDFDPAGEVADVLILLTAIANRLSIDMEQAFRNKEEVNKQRTWN